ncbi:MAG: hypothetical protein V1872_13520 [bacterium]
MKVDRSLQEVWDWKEDVYEETKGLSIKEKIISFKKTSEEFCKKYGLKLKKFHSLER